MVDYPGKMVYGYEIEDERTETGLLINSLWIITSSPCV